MPNPIGFYDSPGERRRRERFERTRSAALEIAEPIILGGLQRAAESVTPVPEPLQAQPFGRPGPPGRERFRSVLGPVAEAPQDRRLTIGPRDGLTLPRPPAFDFPSGEERPLFPAPRPRDLEVLGPITPGTTFPEDVSLDIQELARREVEFGRPLTEPLGRALGEIGTRAAIRAIAPPLTGTEIERRALDVGREVGEVVAPEVLVPSNLIPIPVIDPAIARLLNLAPEGIRAGTRVVPEVLQGLRSRVATLIDNPTVDRKARELVDELGRLLPSERGALGPPQGPGQRPSLVGRRLSDQIGTEVVYHETSADTARLFLQEGTIPRTSFTGRSGLFVSDAPELALGQQGRGATVRLRADRVSGTQRRPPGQPEFMAKELGTNFETTDALSDALIDVTFQPGTLAADRVTARLIRNLEEGRQFAGSRFNVTRNPDGTVVVSRRLEAVGPETPHQITSPDVEDALPARGEVPPEQRPTQLGGASEQFLGPLRPVGQTMSEVVTSDNPVVRALVGKTGINPSILQNTPAGRAMVAYWRQRIAGNELAELATSAALDVHRQRLTGRAVNFRIAQVGKNKGIVQNLAAPEGVSRRWQDVFSHPDRYPNMTTSQRAEIDDFLRVVQEMEFNRVQAGLRPLAKAAQGEVTEAGFYVPRQVEGIRGVELRRPSSPALQRHYEEAADGFARGIDYSADYRATAELHVRVGNKEIADKQFSDLLEELNAEAMQRGERIFVTPKELVPEPVLRDISEATLRRIQAERAVRAERGALIRGRQAIGERIGSAKRRLAQAKERLATVSERGRGRGRQRPLSLGKRITEARQNVRRLEQEFAEARSAFREQPNIREPGRLAPVSEAVRTELDAAMLNFNRAKSRYSKALESARRAETAPGNLFGDPQETIGIAQWRNRFFRREDAERLREGIERFFEPNRQSPFITGTLAVGNYVRFLASVGDFAEPFIQGQLVFGADPAVWARSALRHYQAFFDPTVQSRLMRDFLPEFQEMAAHGTPIGDPEFFAALREGGGLPLGKALELLPKGAEARDLLRQGGKQTFGRFQASYNTGLGSSRAMLTRVVKDIIPDAAERQAFIRNATGGLDSRALGVGPGQRSIEGFLGAFSPRFLRSTVAMVGDLRRGLTDPRGRAAWTSLATLSSAVTGLYVLSGLGLGKSWEEIKTGLNPLEGKKFLSHEVNGDWLGIGGQIRAIVQALAHTGANWDNPGAFFDLDQFENPLIRVYMSRGAPGLNILGGAVEGLTGANVLAFDRIETPVDFLKHVGTSALPFVVQGIMEGEQAITSAFAIAGGRTSPERPSEELARRFEEREGRPYNRETDRAIVEAKHPDLAPLLFQSEGAATVEEALAGPLADIAVVVDQFRQGNNPRSGPQLVQMRSDFKKIAFGATQAAFVDVDFGDPETEAGRIRQQFQEMDAFTDFFDEETSAPDWGAFFREQDRLISEVDKLSPGFEEAYRSRLRWPEELQDVEAQIVRAERLRDELFDKGRYAGLSVGDHDTVRRFLRAVDEQRKIWRDNGHEVELEQSIRIKAQDWEVPQAALDWALCTRSSQSTCALQNRNPEYDQFIIENRAELELFYPGLITNRIRDQMAAQ